MLYAIAGVVAALGLVLVVLGVKKSGLKSQIGATPTTPIGQLNEGQHAEIKGVASTEHPIEAPGFDGPCIYYSYTLKRRERRKSSSGGSSSYHWKTIDSGSNMHPFHSDRCRRQRKS